MLETLQTNGYRIDDYNDYNDNLLYLDYIKNTYEFKEIIIDPNMAYSYQGNLIGLLKALRVEERLFMFTMYINGYNSPYDYDGKRTQFKLAIKPPIPSA